MIDGWHGYLICKVCKAEPNQPCVSMFDHGTLIKGQTPISTPHAGRPHHADYFPLRKRTTQDVRTLAKDIETSFQAEMRLEGVTPDFDPPAPGPIWSNAMADELTALTDAELQQARATVAHFKAKLVQHWAYAALHYLAQDFTALGWERHKAALLHIIESEEL